MLLKGSCQCGDVTFSVESTTPYPYMYCYCGICRKASGGGGYAINLMATNESLEVDGESHVRAFHARRNGSPSEATRHFCGNCGSGLWLWDHRWPDQVHPLASVIDTPLPVPPHRVHIMLAHKAPWVEPDIGPNDLAFDEYPQDSIAEWHEKNGLLTHSGTAIEEKPSE